MNPERILCIEHEHRGLDITAGCGNPPVDESGCGPAYRDPRYGRIILISEIFTFTIENGLIIEGEKDFLLQPYDIVSVRRSPGYEAQRRVVIRGEVTFPGNYSLTTKDETLSSFIKRAGGLTPTAFTKGAKMTRVRSADEREQAATTLELSRFHHRDSIPVESLSLGATYTVGIDLISALREPGSDADLVLRAGDVISIPAMDNVVKISGAVMYPNAVTYKRYVRCRLH